MTFPLPDFRDHRTPKEIARDARINFVIGVGILVIVSTILVLAVIGFSWLIGVI